MRDIRGRQFSDLVGGHTDRPQFEQGHEFLPINTGYPCATVHDEQAGCGINSGFEDTFIPIKGHHLQE